mgnify:CR=1 FL=1
MKNIYYCSSMHGDKYPSNTRSKFSTSIHPRNLDFHTNDAIEVAVKSVLFDNRISHNEIESFDKIPDIILVNQIPKSERLLDAMTVDYNAALIPFDKIEYDQDFSYNFDRRNVINEMEMRDFTITDWHKGFTSTNFIFESLDEENCTVFQLLYINKTEFSSFWDFKVWYNTIYQNVTYKFEDNAKSRVYFGENLIKYLSINPGSKIKKIERLTAKGLEGDMDEINALDNKVIRGKIKAAIVKAKRASK